MSLQLQSLDGVTDASRTVDAFWLRPKTSPDWLQGSTGRHFLVPTSFYEPFVLIFSTKPDGQVGAEHAAAAGAAGRPERAADSADHLRAALPGADAVRRGLLLFLSEAAQRQTDPPAARPLVGARLHRHQDLRVDAAAARLRGSQDPARPRLQQFRLGSGRSPNQQFALVVVVVVVVADVVLLFVELSGGWGIQRRCQSRNHWTGNLGWKQKKKKPFADVNVDGRFRFRRNSRTRCRPTTRPSRAAAPKWNSSTCADRPAAFLPSANSKRYAQTSGHQ